MLFVGVVLLHQLRPLAVALPLILEELFEANSDRSVLSANHLGLHIIDYVNHKLNRQCTASGRQVIGERCTKGIVSLKANILSQVMCIRQVSGT